MRKRQDLTNGDVRGHLWRLGMPMAVGAIAVMSIGMVDAWFLAKWGTARWLPSGFPSLAPLLFSPAPLAFAPATYSLIPRPIVPVTHHGSCPLPTTGLV